MIAVSVAPIVRLTGLLRYARNDKGVGCNRERSAVIQGIKKAGACHRERSAAIQRIKKAFGESALSNKGDWIASLCSQ